MSVAKPTMLWGVAFAAIAFPLSGIAIEAAQGYAGNASFFYKAVQLTLVSISSVVAVWLVLRGLVLRRWEPPTPRCK